MNIDGHPYIYHGDIHIQQCECDDVHSECPGKTQRVNIRIYSEKRTIIFIAM
jgi:hypothetical protein